jgi:DNA polymerase V
MKHTQSVHTKVTSISTAIDNGAQLHPLYASRPAAGFPAPGDDLVEKPLDLNDLLIDNPTSTFFVRVEGESMEGAKIFSGDILVIDRSVTPVSGKIVVAAVYGEMVVKRLSITHSATYLVSEKEGYEPIVVTNNDDCFIWGVVIGSVRKV